MRDGEKPEDLDEAMACGTETDINDPDIRRTIDELCRSKAEEFHMLGYEQVSATEIWDCVSEKYIKSGVPPLHRVVNDILSLKVTQFMNWMTMNIYRGTHLD